MDFSRSPSGSRSGSVNLVIDTIAVGRRMFGELIRLIWIWCVLEKATCFQDRLWAVFHKVFIILTGQRFMDHKSKDVADDLAKWHMKWLVMIVCLFLYICFLGVVYWLTYLERSQKRVEKNFSKRELHVWKGDNYLKRGSAFIVRFIVLPVLWPYFCGGLGLELHHLSTVPMLATFGCAYLCFMFRHRQGDDFGFIDSIVAVQATIIIPACIAGHCHKQWYLAILSSVVPIAMRKFIPGCLMQFWHHDLDSTI